MGRSLVVLVVAAAACGGAGHILVWGTLTGGGTIVPAYEQQQ